MSRDPIVDEVRQARDEYAQRFNYDLWAIYKDLKRQEKTADRPVVNRSERTRAAVLEQPPAPRAASQPAVPQPEPRP